MTRRRKPRSKKTKAPNGIPVPFVRREVFSPKVQSETQCVGVFDSSGEAEILPHVNTVSGWVQTAEYHPIDAELMHAAMARLARDTTEWVRASSGARKTPKKQPHCPGLEWLRAHKDFDGHECLFFPGARKNARRAVRYNFKNMAASRAMLLLTAGLPDDPKAYAIHSCANGHMSCVNPLHLCWGTPADNSRDRVIHEDVREYLPFMDRCVVEEIRQAPGLTKVIAKQFDVPWGVVVGIKDGSIFKAA